MPGWSFGGKTGRLRKNLLHYNAENIDSQIAKIASFSSDFAKHVLAAILKASGADFSVSSGLVFCAVLLFAAGLS